MGWSQSVHLYGEDLWGKQLSMRKRHTKVRVIVVLVKRRPKERPNNTRPLDGAEWQVHPPHHDLVLLVRERDDVGREGLVLLGVLLQASVPYPSSASFLAHGNDGLMGPGSGVDGGGVSHEAEAVGQLYALWQPRRRERALFGER